MALFRLLRIHDQKEFEADARDDEHALAIFGHQLGATLTLVEGPTVAPYLMQLMEKTTSFTKTPGIPVYQVGQASN